MPTFALFGLSLIGAMTATPAVAQNTTQTGNESVDGIANAAIIAAQQRETSGDILGAAMAVERVLAAYPDDSEARAYYASLLCKLGEGEDARRQLAKLDGSGVSKAGWVSVTAACGAMPRPLPVPGGFGMGGDASLGASYDSDILGALAVQFTVPGFVGPKRQAASAIGALRVNGKFRAGSGYIYGGASARTSVSIAGPKSGYDLGEMSVGYGRGGVSAGLIARHARIIQKPFVSEFGAQAEARFAIAPKSNISMRAEIVFQDYAARVSTVPRDGARFDLAFVIDSQRKSGLSLLGGVGFEHKKATTASEGYTGARTFGGVRVPIGRSGAFTNLSATYRLARFATLPGFTNRNDSRLLGRVSIGTPLGDKRIAAEASTSYTRRRFSDASGIRDVNNFGGELRLIWKIGR
jgi:Tetratricopeptide repeat